MERIAADRDSKFQQMMAKIVSEVLTVATVPETSRDLAERLLHRRGRFVEVWLFPYSDPASDIPSRLTDSIQQRARRHLDELNKVRNTSEAQVFLAANPRFFEEFDLRLFRAVQEGKLRGQCSVKPMYRLFQEEHEVTAFNEPPPAIQARHSRRLRDQAIALTGEEPDQGLGGS